jgi:hypothetical protein
MSILPDDFNRKPANGVATRRRFWRGLAERLDGLVAYPTKHAVADQELRRVDDNIKRCRQLMVVKPQRRRDARFERLCMPNAARALKAR